MMYTEKEAKTKWCARDLDATCQGSDCMAWRWEPQLYQHVSMGSPPTRYTDTKEIDGYGRKGPALPRLGYCGLAGKP